MIDPILHHPFTLAYLLGLGYHNLGTRWCWVDSDIYFICLVLDPNYKLAYVEGRWSDTKVASGRARLQAVFDKYYEVPPPHAKEQATAMPTKATQGIRYGESWMRDAVMARQAVDHRTRDPHQELSSYLTSPLEDTDDVVAWWGLHSLQYPTLARVARDYLPIQGSAVPSERAFSSGGITSTLRRNALAPSTFSALQLLKAAYRNGHTSAAEEAEVHAAMLLD